MKGAAQRSVADVQDEIIAEMAGLADSIARYEYLITQGRMLRSPGEGIRSDANAVPGCQVGLWIQARIRDGRLRLSADSDAMINRGIVALLMRVLDDRAPEEILAADLYFLERTGLRTHLSPSRGNGLAAMVQRIRAAAREYAAVTD